MSKDKVFRMRLDDEYSARLEREAAEEGLSKADLVRKRMGWPIVGAGPQAPRPAPNFPTLPADPSGTVIDPERQPGMSAIQQIVQKLQKGS